MRICICTAQVPFETGGAELLVDSLRRQLLGRGFDVEVVGLPFSCLTHEQVLKCAVASRLVELQNDPGRPIDLVIATKFPAYLIPHANKVVWLMHQFRQVYDLLGTEYSDYDRSPAGRQVVQMVREMDKRAFSECRALFTIARTPADRLREFNGFESTVLYPPPPLEGRYRSGDFGDYVFTVGRLNRIKRHDLLIRAIAHTKTPVRALIAGTGEERLELEHLIDDLDLRNRVTMVGRVENDQLIDLFAGCLAVCYPPFDEDYGYVTIEAFKSGKPVLTTADSGGVLEFVEDGHSGFVCPTDNPRALANRIDALFRDRARAKEMGEAGRARVATLTWDAVVSRLTGRLSADRT